jgi:hypothetical protein
MNPRAALSIAAALTCAVLFATASPARADLVDTLTGGACAEQVLDRPFLPFADPLSYVLAPGGTFEAGAPGWTLTGGAAVVDGSEPFALHAEGDARSLELPPGSSATSPAMCVGLLHPTLRHVARNRGGLLSRLDVEVVFADGAGTLHAVPLLPVTGLPGAWAPTLPTPLVVNLATPLAEGLRRVAIRFSVPERAGTWQVDDVYVDPYRK